MGKRSGGNYQRQPRLRGRVNDRADTRASGHLSRYDGSEFINVPQQSLTMQRNLPHAEKALSAVQVPLLFIYAQPNALVNPDT